MPAPEPFCPYCSPTPPLVLLGVRDDEQATRIPLNSPTPYVKLHAVRLVRYHCTNCHREDEVDVPLDWSPERWTGPADCSCGHVGR